jgi:hypothetical protein
MIGARARLLLPVRTPRLGEVRLALPAWRAARASSSHSARQGGPTSREAGRPEWEGEISDEELQKQQRPLRLAVKIIVASWISYKACCYTMDKGGALLATLALLCSRALTPARPGPPTTDNLMVGSTLTLLRSAKEQTRASGLYRVNEWHTGGARR